METYNEKLRRYKKENLSYRTSGEKWFYENYLKNKEKYRRQIILRKRICDFILPNKGIRIELDGKHHEKYGYKKYDLERDRKLFERYGFITLRIKDFDEIKADKVMNFSKRATMSSKERIKFIKENIRGRSIKDVDEKLYDGEHKEMILFWKSLYK